MVLHKLQIMWACTEEETHTLSTNGNTCSLVNAKCTGRPYKRRQQWHRKMFMIRVSPGSKAREFSIIVLIFMSLTNVRKHMHLAK